MNDFNILHEPSRIDGIGAPDFRITGQGGAVVGYVECKNIGKNIDKEIGSEQIEKYKNLSPNIILTDYRQFILLRNTKVCERVNLTNKNSNELANLLEQFFLSKPQKIDSAKELAEALALRCSYLRPHLEEQLKTDKSKLRGLYNAFRETIYHNIDIKIFTDALAQTLVYGLLMAKLKADTANIEISNVDQYIPQNFKLIREITEFVRNLTDVKNNVVDYYVGDILAVINAIDGAAVGKSMSYSNKALTDQDDPYLYFYEHFLAKYDAELREDRGVYYTPPSVVRFIVRATDDILQRDFELDGLKNKKVTALDFATGTGTFMLEMFRTVLDSNKSEAKRQALASEHLLKNFYGFEFLIAPYVIAHLKLSQFLSDKGVALKEEQRINVFLTNTLEEVKKQTEISFMPALTEETNRANKVKKNNILVITGNPPYSGDSQNNGKWIRNLIKDYKKVDGKDLGERNPKWLQDDYVKFMRFAQHKIDQAGEGIVAIITNHGFLDNPTFRGMRQSLLTSFNQLYILDLHGNANKQEHAPDGGKDENIFNIKLGVAISIFIKKKGLPKGVFHADMFGSRASKYSQCEEQSIKSIKWGEIKPTTPFYLFIPHDNKTAKEYDKFYSLKDIFVTNGVGITTAHDNFVINFDEEELLSQFNNFRHEERNTDKLHSLFDVNKKKGWNILKVWDALQNDNDINRYISTISYRPFDNRKIFYENNAVWRTVKKTMQHMLAGDNLGLVSVRQSASSDSWRHCFITEKIIESSHISNKSKEINYLYPLYLYEEEFGKDEKQKRENFDPKFRKWIDGHYGKTYTPEEILGCIYAIMHSPNYRKKYAKFLRMDFPHIPFPKEKTEFTRLSKIGNELIDAHLLKRNCDGKVELHGDKTEVVSKIKHEKGERLYFNKHQYFAPISLSAYNFQIGGYTPLDKFLKSRKGRKLSLDDITTMEKAANAIIFTMKKMQEIDKG